MNVFFQNNYNSFIEKLLKYPLGGMVWKESYSVLHLSKDYNDNRSFFIPFWVKELPFTYIIVCLVFALLIILFIQ